MVIFSGLTFADQNYPTDVLVKYYNDLGRAVAEGRLTPDGRLERLRALAPEDRKAIDDQRARLVERYDALGRDVDAGRITQAQKIETMRALPPEDRILLAEGVRERNARASAEAREAAERSQSAAERSRAEAAAAEEADRRAGQRLDDAVKRYEETNNQFNCALRARGINVPCMPERRAPADSRPRSELNPAPNADQLGMSGIHSAVTGLSTAVQYIPSSTGVPVHLAAVVNALPQQRYL